MRFHYSKEEIITLLKQQGHRITPQRLAIFEFVLSSESHPSSEDVYHAIKKKYPSVSLATIYKNIRLLSNLGLISELNFESQPARYDSNTSPHINVVCPDCGSIVDHESDLLQQIENLLKKEIGGKSELKRIIVNRICNICCQKEKKA
jgi:Fur family peroxide stress response transcriptional regulator